MFKRLFKSAWILAVLVPMLATAQEPEPDRHGSWEFSFSAGAIHHDAELRNFLHSGPVDVRFTNTWGANRLMPLAAVRVGYNFTRNLGLSVSGEGAVGSGVGFLTPSAAITYTLDLNDRTSPFLMAGTELTRILGDNNRETHSTWGALAGIGLRHFLNDILALRVEGRVRIEGFDEDPMVGQTAVSPVATLGLSYFVGGREPATVATCPECPPTPTRRVDTVRVYVPFPSPPDTIVLRDTLVLEGVNFPFDKATLTPASRVVLDDVARQLREPEWANVRFEVAGHTSAVGTAEYNMELSQRRAEAVRAYLVSRGIRDDRMVARGYGQTQPIHREGREGDAWQNRRVELRRIP